MKVCASMTTIKGITIAISSIVLLSVILFDARIHFDRDRIDLKRKHKSAQRHWNIFYDQRYVYADSAFRYELDFKSILPLIEPQTVILSDISSSYYAASYLPVYVKNIHRHHGRHDSSGISSLLKSRQTCYLQDENNRQAFTQFINNHNEKMRNKSLPELRYIIVNKDVKNLNLRLDCLWTARERLMKHIGAIAKLKYQGEYLNLYEIELISN